MTWGGYDGLGTHYSACMNVRGQLCGVAFLLPLSRGALAGTRVTSPKRDNCLYPPSEPFLWPLV